MSPEAKATLWSIVILIGCLAITALISVVSGCGGQPKPVEAPGEADCTGALFHAVLSSDNCNEAQMRTDGILALYPPCHNLYRDGGFNACAKVRDGGHD